MPDYIKLKEKERSIPIEIEGIQELLRRLPSVEQKTKEYLTTQLIYMEAGYRGEVKIDQKIATLPIPALHEYIPNFTTRNKFGSHFQLDSVLVTNRYVLYLEIKNIRGSIEFISNPQQLKRTFDGKIDYMACPLQQTKRNHQELAFLVKNHNPQLPVYAAIVFANPSATIISQQNEVNILYRRQLDLYIEKLNGLPEILDKQQFQKLIKKFKGVTANFHPEALTVRYNIDPKTLIPGIFCSTCSELMISGNPVYTCTTCHTPDTHTLRRTVRALFTILGPHQQVRNFRHHMALSSNGPIIRTLKILKVERKGTTHNSIYTFK